MGNCVKSSKEKVSQSKIPAVTLHQDGLTCSVCSNQYDLATRLPIMICINQHNLCKSCLEKLNVLFEPLCPFCRKSIDLKDIKKNRILCQILEENKKKQTQLTIEETYQQKMERSLREARSNNFKKVVYYIEKRTNVMQVKQLHLWNSQIEKMMDLSIFPVVQSVDLHKNRIKEIRMLDLLTELRYLNISYNAITKIQCLDQLLHLEFLDLCHNQIVKIENLSTLNNLATINLSSNKVETVENLHRLPKLAIIYLKCNPINQANNQPSIQALEDRGVIVQLN